MAVTTFTNYDERMRRLNMQPVSKIAVISGATGSPLVSSWVNGTGGGAIPLTAEAPSITTLGAINQESTIGESGYEHVVARTSFNSSVGIATPILADRVSHQGGLSGIVTTAQTTNLPTTALTRSTSGVGVMAAVEIYTQIGTTQTTATVSYTNQAGTSGRTSQPFLIGGTGYREAGKVLTIMPQDGDTGFRSVESLTLLATTGTQGSFGITLFKPIHRNHPVAAGLEQYGTNTFNNLVGGGMQFEVPPEEACLFVLSHTSGATAITGTYQFMGIS
jgi:hypothetical protein